MLKIISTLGLVCLLGGAVWADEDPVAVSLAIRTAEVHGAFATGEVDIAVVNHLAVNLKDVKLRLVEPIAGSIGNEQSSVAIGDLPLDGTVMAVAPYILEAAFLTSGDPYLVRVTYRLEGSTETSERVVVSVRPEGGAR